MAKRKWLLILLALLLVASAAVFAFWDRIAVYIMPKSVLSKALYSAWTDLQQQFDQSPASLLLGYVDSQGQYTGSMKLKTENKLLGPVRYDMTVQGDTQENRIAAEGVVTASGNDLDLSVYLDRDFMALSSQDLLEGAYYGITYETFPEDIRSIPMLSMVIGDSILSGWDTSVANVQNVMNRSYRLPELPEIAGEDIQRAMKAVMLLPGKVTKVQLPVNGAYVQGFRIDYHAKGEQVADILGYLMDSGDGSDTQICAVFYLYENRLVMMQLQGKSGGNSVSCALELMLDANTRTFRFEADEHGNVQGFCLRHQAEILEGCLQEAWTVYDDFAAKEEGQTLCYRWEPVMGELRIDGETPVTLNIFETEEGLNIQTERFDHLIALLSKREPDPQGDPVACNMRLQKGANIDTPAYKNIRDWSLEDLLVLLGGVGSLLGLKTS